MVHVRFVWHICGVCWGQLYAASLMRFCEALVKRRGAQRINRRIVTSSVQSVLKEQRYCCDKLGVVTVCVLSKVAIRLCLSINIVTMLATKVRPCPLGDVSAVIVRVCCGFFLDRAAWLPVVSRSVRCLVCPRENPNVCLTGRHISNRVDEEGVLWILHVIPLLLMPLKTCSSVFVHSFMCVYVVIYGVQYRKSSYISERR